MAGQSPQSPQQGQGQAGEPGVTGSSTDFFWMIIVIAVICLLLWLARDKYMPFLLNLKIQEMNFISNFVPINQAVIEKLQFYQQNPTKFSFMELINLLNVANNYFKYFLSLIVFVLAITLYLTSVGARFKKTYTMQRLLGTEKEIWPQIVPASKENILKEDINKGPWASALTPMLFAQKHKLLIEETIAPENILQGPSKTIVSIDEKKALQVFHQQLGPLWQGPDALPAHYRALFAVFSARINEDSKSATKILDHINESLRNNQKPAFSVYQETFNKYKNSEKIQEICSKHAYVLTVMSSLLEEAREDGVISTADFIWLKLYDRKLWYVLNNIGRVTAFCESAGVFAHWKIEKRISRSLISPYINEAVTALKDAISEIIYDPKSNPFVDETK